MRLQPSNPEKYTSGHKARTHLVFSLRKNADNVEQSAYMPRFMAKAYLLHTLQGHKALATAWGIGFWIYSLGFRVEGLGCRFADQASTLSIRHVAT